MPCEAAMGMMMSAELWPVELQAGGVGSPYLRNLPDDPGGPTGAAADARTRFPIEHDRGNSLGFLRLLFASLVIVSHTTELLRGDRSSEPLAMIFGTLSLGDLAVNGFFVISGYLITKSYLGTTRVRDYLVKRIARILPGFVVAWLVVAMIVAPLAGGQEGVSILGQAGWSFLLQAPYSSQAFSGTYHNSLNAPLWTIPWEFACYLLVVALSCARIVTKPIVLGAAAIVLLIVPHLLLRLPLPIDLGSIYPILLNGGRLVGMFLAGATFMLIADDRIYSTKGAIAAVTVLVACLPFASLASIGVAIGGTYLIFFVGFRSRSTLLRTINARNDISYGVYLYAWPIEKLLIMYLGFTSMIVLGAVTLILAFAAGYLSWVYVEKPAVGIARRLIR
jgi:peptidoglycan/LPS O-acetylase OafA/YrhL